MQNALLCVDFNIQIPMQILHFNSKIKEIGKIIDVIVKKLFIGNLNVLIIKYRIDTSKKFCVKICVIYKRQILNKRQLIKYSH